MRVCYYWPRFQSFGERDAAPIDAFFVEATASEAEILIFPRLPAKKIRESQEIAEDFANVAAELGTPPRPFCFLVTRDLNRIEPHPPHYPFHQLWNAYSPFRQVPEQSVATLEDLRAIQRPPQDIGVAG